MNRFKPKELTLKHELSVFSIFHHPRSRTKLLFFKRIPRSLKGPGCVLWGVGSVPTPTRRLVQLPGPLFLLSEKFFFFFFNYFIYWCPAQEFLFRKGIPLLRNKNKAPNPNDLFISCPHTMVFWISRNTSPSPVPNIPDISPYYHNTLILPLSTWVLVGPLFKTGERPGIQRFRSHGPSSQTCCGQREAV